MKKIFTLLLVAFSFAAHSQSYFVSQIPYNPMPFDSGVNVVSAIDDTWSAPIPIGFDFYFFGIPYQQLVLGTNCLLTFDLAQAGQYCQWPISDPIPSVSNPMNSIMFPYQDLDPSVGGTIHHQVYGTPPNRIFVLSFDTVPFFQCNDTTFTGQLILYESTGNIEMYLHEKNLCPTWNGGTGILGVQDATGTEAYWASNYNYPVQWTAADEAWLFSPDSNYASNLDRISGRVFADLDHDCAFGGTDYPLMNKPVLFDDGSSTVYSFTDMQGYYSKLVNPGIYTFTTANIANQNYSSNCPVGGTYTVNFASYNDSSDNNLFADTIVNFCSDISVSLWAYGEPDSLWGWTFAPLGVCDTGYIQLNVANSGTVDDTVNLVLTLNDSTDILNSPVAYTALGNNQYSFDLGWMAPGSSNTFTIMIQAGCDTIGTTYCFGAATSGTVYDCQSFNNDDAMCVQIGVPFDPNAMYVSSSLHPSSGVTDYLITEDNDDLNYTITFQNTGSAVAHDVTVKTILDPHLNAVTITPGSSNHAYNWLVMNNTLIFEFNNIELPDSSSNEPASHGFVRFKIQQQGGNSAGTVIPQMADIYFDYLNPVATNDALVQIEQTESVSDPLSAETILIYPNPANVFFTIMNVTKGTYSVLDVMGKNITHGVISSATKVDASQWASGIYFIAIKTDAGLQMVKVVKD